MADNKIGKKYGILAGVGVVLYFMLFYYIDKGIMLGMEISWSSLLIVSACVFVAVYQYRASNEGLLNFKDGLKTGFLVIVLSNLIFYLFFYLLINSDPELATILKQQSIEFDTSFLGLPAEEVKTKYENYTFGFPNAALGFARSTIGGFFIALLAALLLKRSTIRTDYLS